MVVSFVAANVPNEVEHAPKFGHVEIHGGEEVEVARHSMV